MKTMFLTWLGAAMVSPAAMALVAPPYYYNALYKAVLSDSCVRVDDVRKDGIKTPIQVCSQKRASALAYVLHSSGYAEIHGPSGLLTQAPNPAGPIRPFVGEQFQTGLDGNPYFVQVDAGKHASGAIELAVKKAKIDFYCDNIMDPHGQAHLSAQQAFTEIFDSSYDSVPVSIVSQ